jgi:hypothetical protein
MFKKFIRRSVLPSILAGLLNYFFIETPHTVNNYALVVANTFTIFLTLALFNQVLRDKRIISLRKDTKIWIALGSFLYYSATLPFFMFFNFLLREHLSLALSYLYINDGLNIIMYTLYLIAYLCTPQQQQ